MSMSPQGSRHLETPPRHGKSNPCLWWPEFQQGSASALIQTSIRLLKDSTDDHVRGLVLKNPEAQLPSTQ